LSEPILLPEGLIVAMASTDPPTQPARTRRRLSRVLIALLVAALVVVVVGALVAHRAVQERQDAVDRRGRAQTGLGVQQNRSTASLLDADLDRTSAQSYMDSTPAPLATSQQINQLADQELPQITLLQAAGRASQWTVYNRIADQLNAERYQYRADRDQFNFQLDAMPPS